MFRIVVGVGKMFRVEALAAQKQKLHGDVFLIQPITFAAITLTVVSTAALAVLLLVTGSYARSEHVAGHLVPSKGLVKIQASQFGTLTQLYVREGDLVTKGQSLADIQMSHNTLDGRSLAQKNLEALALQSGIIDTQIMLEQHRLEADLGQLSSEIAEVRLKVESLGRQVVLQKLITASADAQYKDMLAIRGKGYISKVETERQRMTWLDQQAQEQLRAQEFGEANARFEQLDIRYESLPNESKQRLARLEAQRAELGSRRAELEGRGAYAVTSPVDGRVVSISTNNVGRTVQSGQPILAILPEGSTLEAELFVPSRAAGFVEVGQEVRLLYDAFPYQRFGSYTAKIIRVSGTILAPNEISAPFVINEPVYRVTAAIDTDKIRARGKEIALQSGMTLQANIVLERRSFLDWLLDPVRAVADRL